MLVLLQEPQTLAVLLRLVVGVLRLRRKGQKQLHDKLKKIGNE